MCCGHCLAALCGFLSDKTDATDARLHEWLHVQNGDGAQVPCVAVVENMSYFDGHDGTRYRPFGAGSGDRVVADFGLPHLVRFPIIADLSAAGDGAADDL